jgi:LVIVD repeat
VRKILLVVLMILMAVPATAPAAIDRGPSAGGLSSDNVEFVGHVPYAIDGVGGRVVGKYFYVNDQNKLMIFSIKNPTDPQLVGYLPMPQEWLFGREDIDTNGKILLLPNLGTLHIVDVEDKSNPTIIASLANAGEHTNSCILGCRYAYGSEGNIVDLRNPSKPKELKQEWGGGGKPAASGHDVTEVRPGIILTSTQPMMVLDARKNPTNPKLLAFGRNLDGRFIHSSVWPRRGMDRFILAGGETNFKPRCNETNGAFMTWNASKWRQGKLEMIDEYRMVNGTYADGSPAVNQAGCSSHWLEANPKFRNGGIAAGAFFEHGTRFINVTSTGKIKEIGWFMPFGGSTGAIYWITPRILYAIDYNRGMDILKYTGKL